MLTPTQRPKTADTVVSIDLHGCRYTYLYPGEPGEVVVIHLRVVQTFLCKLLPGMLPSSALCQT